MASRDVPHHRGFRQPCPGQVTPEYDAEFADDCRRTPARQRPRQGAATGLSPRSASASRRHGPSSWAICGSPVRRANASPASTSADMLSRDRLRVHQVVDARGSSSTRRRPGRHTRAPFAGLLRRCETVSIGSNHAREREHQTRLGGAGLVARATPTSRIRRTSRYAAASAAAPMAVRRHAAGPIRAGPGPCSSQTRRASRVSQPRVATSPAK